MKDTLTDITELLYNFFAKKSTDKGIFDKKILFNWKFYIAFR